MLKIKIILNRAFSILLILMSSVFIFSQSAFADLAHQSNNLKGPPLKTVQEHRSEKEKEILNNRFSIAFHKPTYILPYYYTGSPYKSVYQGSTPNNESIDRSEFKYQLSFKTPIWRSEPYNYQIYLAYTQLSYWQLYNKMAFFRETDYEPELFISKEINFNLLNFKLNLINLGAVHQSNGFGNALERSWNRIYLELISSNDRWLLSIKPWYILNDSTMREYNPDIAKYLGYGVVTFSYKYGDQIFSIQARNMIESAARKSSAELTWSFPLALHINGYVQAFSGYGQSLIEYNHRTNSIGVGVTLSNRM